MIKLSYSSNGLTNLGLYEAIDAVEKSGYAGIELSFQKWQFNPFQLTDQELFALRDHFKSKQIKPACIATPTISFLTDRPHEPSIICIDPAGRKQRINLIKKGIKIAKILGAPIVSFGSGFIRDDHINFPEINLRHLLIDGIKECLKDIGNIILVIEPEPGMYIETMDQGIDLVKEVNSMNFRLHIDLCHTFCSDVNYLDAITAAAPLTSYLHVSDTKEGYNLKIVQNTHDQEYDLDFASYLVYFPENCGFVFLSKEKAIYFYDDLSNREESEVVLSFAQRLKLASAVIEYRNYNELYMGPSELDKEINIYVVSVAKLSFCVLDRAKPILRYLRESKNDPQDKPIINKMLANTITGMVHFHDIPGNGLIDFPACFKRLIDEKFSGYATVELYHHTDDWHEALYKSIKVLKKYI